MELQLIGLVGPTHNYAGLAKGNLASMQHAKLVSYPKKAALECINLMRFLHIQGVPVAVMPPHPRPNLDLINTNPTAAYSAASMWVANAATVSASTDTSDRKVHFTPANLKNTAHRAQECAMNAKLLAKIFANPEYFVHHPATWAADEGAANHCRVYSDSKKIWHNLFIYGASHKIQPKKFPARQSYEASLQIIAEHNLNPKYCHLIQQNPAVIDAGVFHNDVIAMSNQNLLIIHEQAWLNQNNILINLDGVKIIVIKNTQLTVAEAVDSYIFNGQLISLSDSKMLLVLPVECQTKKILQLINEWLDDANNPIKKVHFIDVKQSMQNGGGPACLRLRVPLTTQEYINVDPQYIVTEKLLNELENFIKQYYPESIIPDERHFNDLKIYFQNIYTNLCTFF
jgi:succinylarginine dihydrolase